MPDALRTDVHQHVWTAPLLAALAERDRLPFIRHSHGLTVLHCVGEQPYVIDVEAERPERRAQLLRSDGLGLALVALSSPIGVEGLPASEAQALIDAHLDGVGALGPGFLPWGALALDRLDPDRIDDLLARGCVGLALPAFALTGLDNLHALGPVLERLHERAAPLFVHPGPRTSHGTLDEPLWWPALTDYVAQMQAAWLSFQALARRDHSDLKVIFAMLAGGAPLLSERLQARGGPPTDPRDPATFYETSSYGPTAIEAMARRVGSDQLFYGSDRPVVDPETLPTGREAPLQLSAGQFILDLGFAASPQPGWPATAAVPV